MALAPEQYLRPDIIQQVQRLDLRARFIVEGFLAGLHKSPFQGFSVEFSEHRKYTAGDDLRLIDWSVYGKTDRYYIKKFEAETNLEAYILMDCSGSMDYSSGDRMTKMDYGICLAAALGYMMITQQDPVGLFVFDTKLRSFLPPKTKRMHLTNILSSLARTKPFGLTGLGASINEIASRIHKRSLMILISDLLDDQQKVVEALRHLRYRGHDVIVFQVLDHSELKLDFEGQVRFDDPETGRGVGTNPQSIRSEYQREIQQFIDEYRSQCQGIGVDFVTVDNSMTFDRALMDFLVQRKERF